MAGSGASVAQSYGQTAAYAINNQNNVQYSNSNTITNALPGVTLNLQAAQANGSSPVTVTVNRNTGDPPVTDPNPVFAELQPAGPPPRQKGMKPKKVKKPKPAAAAPAADQSPFPDPNAPKQ